MSEPDGVSGELIDGHHELVQRVYFEDTDFSGLVYHARYLQFMERGRSDFLRLIGIHHRELMKHGLAFAVRRIAIEFFRAAAIDDLLRVTTRPARVGGARIELDQAVHRGGDLLVEATVTVALVGRAGKAARLPAEVRRALESFAPR